MEIRKSVEDYLEMMLMLQEKHGYIRSIDIAKSFTSKNSGILCDKAFEGKWLYYYERG